MQHGDSVVVEVVSATEPVNALAPVAQPPTLVRRADQLVARLLVIEQKHQGQDYAWIFWAKAWLAGARGEFGASRAMEHAEGRLSGFFDAGLLPDDVRILRARAAASTAALAWMATVFTIHPDHVITTATEELALGHERKALELIGLLEQQHATSRLKVADPKLRTALLRLYREHVAGERLERNLQAAREPTSLLVEAVNRSSDAFAERVQEVLTLLALELDEPVATAVPSC